MESATIILYNYVRFCVCVSKLSSLSFSAAPCHTLPHIHAPHTKVKRNIFFPRLLLLFAFFNSCWRPFCSGVDSIRAKALFNCLSRTRTKSLSTQWQRVNSFVWFYFPSYLPLRTKSKIQAHEKNTNDLKKKKKIENGKLIFGVECVALGVAMIEYVKRYTKETALKRAWSVK